ncbi:anaerobic glycerol-3-phosphate dehydrogenase subunit C [Desulfosarcina sp. OttesenSCG-928-B08]|nr:anaerobic glycerol-3-phosphate dehydrogenase subunit C [Desulfosarcina sp. OttesenSCG-928-B08]
MSLLDETSFEACTKCTICTEYCPVSEFNTAYPGPKQSGPDGARLRLKDPANFDEALKYCTNCKRCEIHCPSGVKIGDIIQLARQQYDKKMPLPRDAMLSHTDFFGTLAATPLAPLLNRTLEFPLAKKALETGFGIPSARVFPAYAPQTFRCWFVSQAKAGQTRYADLIALFHGCYINYNNPDLGRDTVSVLNAFGIGVTLLDKEHCCGIPLIASGFFRKARKNARFNSNVIGRTVDSGFSVVVPSSTCAMTLRNEYPHLLDVDNAAWRSKVDLLSRFLHRLWASGRNPELRPLKLKVAYHTACHMEKIGWASYSVDLLRRIPGVEVITLPSTCCGIAGTYGFKSEYYDTSQKIGAELFRRIEASGADIVACDCETCKMQIEMSTTKKCEHPVSILARSLGGKIENGWKS